MPYEDGATNIFLYCNGTEGNSTKELSELLHYIRNTKKENAVNQDLKRLQSIVDEVRGDAEVSKEYMLWSLRIEEYMEDAREEGREEGHVQTVILQVIKKRAKGKDIPQIADELEDDEQYIQQIIDAMEACGNTTDPQVIYDAMMKKPEMTQ